MPIWVQIMVAVGSMLLGGAGLAALINQIGESKRLKQKHGYEVEAQEKEKELHSVEKIEADLTAVRSDVDALKMAMKYVMYDRIRYLGRAYLRDGEVSFDDRRILNEMHDSYHKGLGGNGDLDNLMKLVMELPLKED